MDNFVDVIQSLSIIFLGVAFIMHISRGGW